MRQYRRGKDGFCEYNAYYQEDGEFQQLEKL
jgi:hypothetical protein